MGQRVDLVTDSLTASFPDGPRHGLDDRAATLPARGSGEAGAQHRAALRDIDPREAPVQVFVRDNNVDMALKALKRKMQREGVFKEMKRRRFYEKPSERTTREKAEAVRRLRKAARKQAVREGLIAAPKKKVVAPRRSGFARAPR